MTLIEAVLLFLSILLGFCLIYFKQLSRLAKKYVSPQKYRLKKINLFFKIIYQILLKLRRFSVVYVLKNQYYRIYLAIALSIVITKIGWHYQPQTAQNAPLWVHKITDFLIISSAWELICLGTKIIEQQLNKKS